jgi:hypothetical protein
MLTPKFGEIQIRLGHPIRLGSLGGQTGCPVAGVAIGRKAV